MCGRSLLNLLWRGARGRHRALAAQGTVRAWCAWGPASSSWITEREENMEATSSSTLLRTGKKALVQRNFGCRTRQTRQAQEALPSWRKNWRPEWGGCLTKASSGLTEFSGGVSAPRDEVFVTQLEADHSYSVKGDHKFFQNNQAGVTSGTLGKNGIINIYILSSKLSLLIMCLLS